jgi:hypothetical protein
MIGVLVQVPLGMWHPHREDPNNSVAVFQEYSHADDWVIVHLGQFAGTLLITFGLVSLAYSLSAQEGIRGTLARWAATATVILAAVFAVQMAVDGIALKAAIDAWAAAPLGPEKSAAFLVADGMRGLEKGLAALFQITNGVALIALGLALPTARWLTHCLRWIAVTGGLAFVIGGTVVALTGFSTIASNIALVPTAIVPVFLLGAAMLMWQSRADTT